MEELKMDDAIVISDSESTEEEDQGGLLLQAASWGAWSDWDVSGTQDLIDLTLDECVIDLTGNEDCSLSPVESCFQDIHVNPNSPLISSSISRGGLSPTQDSGEMCLSGGLGPFKDLLLELEHLSGKHHLRTSFTGPVSPRTTFTGPVSPRTTFTGPVSPRTTLTGPVSPRTTLTGPVSPRTTLTGPVSPRTTLTGPVSPRTTLTGPVSPRTTLTGPVSPRTTLTGPVSPKSVNHKEATSYSIDRCLKGTLKNGFSSHVFLPACTSSDTKPKCEPDPVLSQPMTLSTSVLPAIKQEDQVGPAAENLPLNKALLYKLGYFNKPPVSHFFFHTVKHDKKLHAKPIPLSRMMIVNNTKDEGFHQGTLHFLANFVTAHYYPPKEIISHVVQSILLGAEEDCIKHEAYVILMKVQKLHPARLDTVAWDWSLLSEVMRNKERKTGCLLLQYVVQTLDDDFQLALKRRSLQKCLCKRILSCEQRFCNVKDVIHWLIDILKSPSENGLESCSQYEGQRMVFLLQRMISIAVEIDNSPVTNSKRIANEMVHYIFDMKTQQQRQLFLCSTENLLLQAEILEVIFHSSCVTPPSQDLSLVGKILFFISNSALHLENQGLPEQKHLIQTKFWNWLHAHTDNLGISVFFYPDSLLGLKNSQGPEWHTWDEMLHYICLLFLALQKIKTGHLQISIINRIDEMLQPHNPSLMSEEITEDDVKKCLNTFQKRVYPGEEMPPPLNQRLSMIQCLLLAAVKHME